MSDEEKKVEITKAKFTQGLETYTSWIQVKNFIKNSPAAVKNMTAGKMQEEIDNMTEQIDNLTEMKDFLISLKSEIVAL